MISSLAACRFLTLQTDFEISDMEVDGDVSKSNSQSKSRKHRIEKKRSSRKASIVFPKYKKGPKAGKSRGKK